MYSADSAEKDRDCPRAYIPRSDHVLRITCCGYRLLSYLNQAVPARGRRASLAHPVKVSARYANPNPNPNPDPSQVTPRFARPSGECEREICEPEPQPQP